MAERSEFELGVITEPLRRGLAQAKGMFIAFGAVVKERLKDVGRVLLEQLPLIATDFATKLREGFSALRELDPVLNRLESLIRATGSAAGFSARELTDMARSLRDLAAVSTDAVVAAEEVLLKLTNIRGDVFQDALTAAADFAAVMGRDLASAAQTVGSALNDPIEGMRVLRQEGILFTLQEGQMIEALVYSGRVMEAQRIILEKLAGAFGGEAARQADTFTGKLNRMNNTLRDAWRSIAEALTPAFDLLLPLVEQGAEFMEEMSGKLRAMTEAAVEFAQDSWPMIKQWIERVADGVRQLASFVGEKMLEGFTIAQTAVQNFRETIDTMKVGVELAWLKLIDVLREPWARFVTWLEETLVVGLKRAATNAMAGIVDTLSGLIDKIPRIEGSPMARDLNRLSQGLSLAAAATRGAAPIAFSDEEREARVQRRIGERDSAEIDSLQRQFDEMMQGFGPSFDENLGRNREAVEGFFERLRAGFAALGSIEAKERDRREREGERPFVLGTGGEGRGGAIEDLLSLRRRIQSSAFKTPEAIALDKQTLIMSASHQHAMQAQKANEQQNDENTEKIVQAIGKISTGLV